MKLTAKETKRLIDLLQKAAGAAQAAGKYVVYVTPKIFAPEDFKPRQKVCIGSISNVVGEVVLQQ
jgi:hypothetical protein